MGSPSATPARRCSAVAARGAGWTRCSPPARSRATPCCSHTPRASGGRSGGRIGSKRSRATHGSASGPRNSGRAASRPAWTRPRRLPAPPSPVRTPPSLRRRSLFRGARRRASLPVRRCRVRHPRRGALSRAAPGQPVRLYHLPRQLSPGVDTHLGQWLNLALRWGHVITGVAWIGTSFYFNWLNSRLAPPPPERAEPGVAGELWSVHGGGFYRVVKYAVAPTRLPPTLHWFKWEAYATWLTGFALLAWVNYVGAAAYLVDPQVSRLGPRAAIA